MTTRTASNVVAFRPRPAAAAAPQSDTALVARLLDLARDLDTAGRPHVAGLLVGAAYAMCDDLPPIGGGHCRTA